MPASWLSAIRQFFTVQSSLPMSNQTPEPCVLLETASLDDNPPAQADLVAAGLPAAIEILGVVPSRHAVREEQVVSPVRAPAELAVVLERAAADDLVGPEKRGAAGVGLLEDAILDHVSAAVERAAPC